MAKEAEKKQNATEIIITDICNNIRNGIIPPEAKINPESKLVEKYNANLYTVRKALNILKDREILYSIPKFGVFVSPRAAQLLTEQSQNNSNKNFNPEITLACRSHLAGQRAIWEQIAKKYAASPLGGRLKLHYVPSSEEIFPKADIYEYGSMSISFFRNKELLDIKKFFPYIIENKSALINPYSIPFYYVTPLLIFNKNILKKLNMPLPSYTNYAEQKEYIEAVTSAAEKHYDKSTTAQELILHFGNDLLNDFFTFIHDNNTSENDFFSRFSGKFREITNFWRKNAVSYHHGTNSAYNKFILGNTPFLFGTTSNLISLKESDIDFETGGAMMYSLDNTFCLEQVFLSIDKNIENPIECIRALHHFQNNDIQKSIAESGALPLNAQNYQYLPFDLIIPAKHAASPIKFNNYDEYYIGRRIICTELWEVIICGKTLENCMRDMLRYSKSYLAMKNS